MITFLCHDCQTNTNPIEGIGNGFCNHCGKNLSHFIQWKSPDEDLAASILIDSELKLALGGWGFYRINKAIQDALEEAKNTKDKK